MPRVLGLDAELVEDGIEDEAGAGFGVGVDIDREFDASRGLGGGGDVNSGIGSTGLGEGGEFAALGGDGGFVDDMTLAEEFLLGGDEDRFGADAWREFCFE